MEEIVKQIEEMLGYLATILVVLTTLSTYLIKLVSKMKEVKKLKNKEISLVEIKELMSEAEKLFTLGTEKKKYVIEKMKIFTKDNKIKFNKEEVSLMIEELVILTKQINNKCNVKEEEKSDVRTSIKWY